jgi:hypothetical protein
MGVRGFAESSRNKKNAILILALFGLSIGERNASVTRTTYGATEGRSQDPLRKPAARFTVA